MRKALFLGLSASSFLAAIAVQSAAYAAGSPIVADYRRLTESEYRNSIADVFGSDIKVQGHFEPEVRVGGLLAGSTTVLSVTPAGFQGYAQLANAIAEQVVSQANRGKLPCVPKAQDLPDDRCAAQIFNGIGLKLFRRPLSTGDVKARVELASKMAKTKKDFYAGLRFGLASMLASPNFLFRTEVAIPNGANGYTLDDYSRAERLSYLLWDTTPDSQLLEQAAKGELSTTAGIARQVDRMMASPRLEVGMRAFFTDLMAPDYYGNVNKDPAAYPQWSESVSSSAKEETLKTIIDLALVQKGDLRDILTTRKTFINRKLAAAYDIPFEFGADWVPYEYPKDSNRSGVLTQLSVLAMFSHPARSSPTERGKAVLDIFLCSPTPPPPPNVDFSLVNDVNNQTLKTVRQRLLAHATNPTCKSCHTRMDPIGLSLETFDAGGRYRSVENNEKIDVSATINGKSFSGAAGLGQVLHDDPRFAACMARKMYSYTRGDDVYKTKPPQYAAALEAFKNGGYRLPTLLRALATSPEIFAVTPPVTATNEKPDNKLKKTALNDR